MFIGIVTEWNSYLDKFSPGDKDIYYTEEYVKLYETSVDKALCIIYEDNGFVMLMPFLQRKIDSFFDFETPYGYGGPIFNQDCKTSINKALIAMCNYFHDNTYIAGFVRFHPLLGNANKCNEVIPVLDDRQTIAIDTSLSEEEIWNTEINTKNRNTIRRAQKARLLFEADQKFHYLKNFIELYNRTMQRLSADEFYFFSEKYYYDFSESLSNNSFLGVVKYENKIIAAAIFMYNQCYGHYHLSGSDKDFQNLSPNNLLLFEAAKELKRRGIKKFHLGGGSDSDPKNSLLEFKSRFGKEHCQFSIGKLIFNESAYQNICRSWILKNPQKVNTHKNILLKYRY